MITSDFSLRRVTPGDRDAVWALRTRAIVETCSSHYDAETIRRWSGSNMPQDFAAPVESRDFIVAEADGVLAGFGLLDRQRGEVAAVFVHPEFCGKGIGTRLLRELEDLAWKNGLDRLRLFASLNAVNFYRAAGYRELRQDKYHHRDGFEMDCMLMEKLGIASPEAGRES